MLRRRSLVAGPWAVSALMLPPIHGIAGVADKDFLTILDRIRADFRAEGGVGDAADAIARQIPDGSWPDVNYADRSLANWLPMTHLVRLRRIARALAEPSLVLQGRANATRVLNQGVAYWLNQGPRPESWWFNTIGQQREIMRILVLAGEQLQPDLALRLRAMLFDPTMVPSAQNTGQNRVWYATSQLVRGVLARDGTDLSAASAALASVMNVTLAEGIQPDYSFHQHRAQLYTGGYGLAFLQDLAQLANWLQDTIWALPLPALRTLGDYALQGMLPLVRGNWFDWSARGREITRTVRIPRPRLLAISMSRLAPAVPVQQEALLGAAEKLQRGSPAAVGTFPFWRSDFLVHSTGRVYFSVKLCSARTVGTESGNGENLQGFWLPFGVTYQLKRGDEYDGLPPVWNWACLPGLTAPEMVPPLKGYQTHAERFVGVLAAEAVGVAAMSMKKEGMRGKLAWFFVGDLMVAMGSAISCTQPQPVWTTLNQCRLNGPVHSNFGILNNQDVVTAGTRWIWHDGLTYVFIEGPQPMLSREARRQSLSAVTTAEPNREVEASVFMLRLAHGATPADAGFAYAVWAGASSPEQVTTMPIPVILANSRAVQAVGMSDRLTYLAVMHEPGALTLDGGWLLRVDAPCLIIAQRAAGALKIKIGDPTRRPEGILVTVTTPSAQTESEVLTISEDPSREYSSTWTVAA